MSPITVHGQEIQTMKCTNCGSEVDPAAVVCSSCGCAVSGQNAAKKTEKQTSQTPVATEKAAAKVVGARGKFVHADVAKKLKFDYTYGPKDSSEKALAGLEPLFATYRKPRAKTNDLLEQAATMIYKQLRIKEVSIGLLDQKDGLYRYKVMAGMRTGIWRAHKDLAYTKEDFSRNDRWKGTAISRYSKLMLAEDNPYHEGEEDTVDRQEMMASKRHDLNDSVEGDYMDVEIRGMSDELIGWIEVSGTWTSKIPDPHTVRFVELVACTLGLMLSSNPSLAIYRR